MSQVLPRHNPDVIQHKNDVQCNMEWVSPQELAERDWKQPHFGLETQVLDFATHLS